MFNPNTQFKPRRVVEFEGQFYVLVGQGRNAVWLRARDGSPAAHPDSRSMLKDTPTELFRDYWHFWCFDDGCAFANNLHNV